MARVVVVGPIGRDLVLRIPRLPEAGGSVAVERRREPLGGKGANLALACRQLGVDAALVGAVGDDDAGTAVLAEAAADGLDVEGVVRRAGATALFVDLLEPGGVRRLLEDQAVAHGLTADDVTASAGAIRVADALLLPLAQPPEAVLTALDLVGESGALVLADGAPGSDEVRSAVLRRADIVRADAGEAVAYLGDTGEVARALRRARELLSRGPRLVAFGVPGGDAVVWEDGELVLEHRSSAVDPTGAGDSFAAALTVSLLRGDRVPDAARFASAAAGDTASREGARPALRSARLR